MKRATSMLGALALMAAGFLFAAPAAQATHSTIPTNPGSCTLVTTSFNWPGNGHYYNCGDLSTLDAKSYSLPPHLKTKFANSNVSVIKWKSAIDADAYFGNTAPNRWQDQYRSYGATVDAPQGIIVNLFERVRGHGGCNPTQFCAVSSSEFGDAYDHEVGHALDFAFGEPSQTSSTFSTAVSSSWTRVNGLPATTVFPNGIPTKKSTDLTTWVTYTIPPTTDPKRNEKILKELLPDHFSGTAKAKAEMFAYAYQQYKGALAPFDWTNPYGTKYTALPPPHPNGTKLFDLEDIYKRMFELDKVGGSAPVSYMHKIWTDSTFIP